MHSPNILKGSTVQEVQETSVFQAFFNHAHFLPMFGLHFSNKEKQLCTISCFTTSKTETEDND